MFFKQLLTKDASLSYFFGCAGQGFAAIPRPKAVIAGRVGLADEGGP